MMSVVFLQQRAWETKLTFHFWSVISMHLLHALNARWRVVKVANVSKAAEPFVSNSSSEAGSVIGTLPFIIHILTQC